MADLFQDYVVDRTPACTNKTFVMIIGRVQDNQFHIGQLSSKIVERYHADVIEVSTKPLCEVDWRAFLLHCKTVMQGITWGISTETVVFMDGVYFGDSYKLLDWLHDKFEYAEYRPLPLFDAITTLETREFFSTKKRSFVFMEITIGESQFSDRLVIELCDDICPITCRNFRDLCTNDTSGKGYSGTVFHRVVKNGWIQGGDIVDGSGGNSVASSGDEFDDECFALKHDRRGMLGMANHGRNTCGSQFYFTFSPTAWMDKKLVAFGRIVTGWDLLNALEAVDAMNERPIESCRIQSCGVWLPP